MAIVRVGDLGARDIGAGIKVVLDDDFIMAGYYDRVTGILVDYDYEFDMGTLNGQSMSLMIESYKGLRIKVGGLSDDFLVTVYER